MNDQVVTVRADCDPELDALVEVVAREHAALRRVFHEALEHALTAGRALLQIKTRLSDGAARGQGWGAPQFYGWVKSRTGVSQLTASTYMRLATYEAEIREALSGGVVNSIESRRAFVKTLPPVNDGLGRRLREMKQAGMSAEAIAAVLGYHPSYVETLLDPASAQQKVRREREARQRRKKAARALKEAERERTIKKAVKEHGGHLSQAYSLCRRLLAALDKQIDETDVKEWEKRDALAAALKAAHQCEDAIVAGVKAERCNG